MIRKIVHGYGKLLVSILKILILVALCALFPLVLVLPLWKFASVAPEVYSFFVLFLNLMTLSVWMVIFFSGKSVRHFLTVGFPSAQERKQRVNRLLKGLGKVLIILLGICGIVMCILAEAVAAAWMVLLETIIIYGVIAFGTKKEKKQ